MNRLLKMIISSLIAATISGGGALVTALTAMPANTPISSIGVVTWVVALVSGLSSAGKDWQAYLADPKGDQ